MSKDLTIFLHLPAYREPELIPTIEDALKQAKYPNRLHFGICRQYEPEDGFDNLTSYKDNPNFHIHEMLAKDSQGLPYARAIINEKLLTDQDYILQLDSHHRFVKNWDEILINMHKRLERKGYRPVLTGYLPEYKPFEEPEGRADCPWLSIPNCFYPHGTIFIQPTKLEGWEDLKEPVPSRFVCGHFAFARNKWAKEIKHDPDLYFSGEEINLTVRTFTHGYDLFHPHKLVIWHATMREERDGILVWDDQSKAGNDMYWKKQDSGRAKIRQLFGVEDNGYDLTGYDLGTERTFRDYEIYSGLHFKKRAMQQHTLDWKYPPNPIIGENEEEWEESFQKSHYHLVTILPSDFTKKDYDFILVAFDDENGESIKSIFIDDNRLTRFLKEQTPIHYEQTFMSVKQPSKVVYWAHSKSKGWSERKEFEYK